MDSNEKMSRYLDTYQKASFGPPGETRDEEYIEGIRHIAGIRKRRRQVRSVVLSVAGALILTLATWNGGHFVSSYQSENQQVIEYLTALRAESLPVVEQIESSRVDMDQLAEKLLGTQYTGYYLLFDDASRDTEEIIADFDDDMVEETMNRLKNMKLL